MLYVGADLARVCNICFAMLFDDAALEATFSDFMKTAPTGAHVVQPSHNIQQLTAHTVSTHTACRVC